MAGVSALPRAQGWCGRARGSSGTWLALEFYCEPARAWHSHENGYGRTEGRKERMKESEGGSRGGKQMQGGSGWVGGWGGQGGTGGGSVFCCCGFGLFAGGSDYKGRLVAGFGGGVKDERQKINNKGQKKN